MSHTSLTLPTRSQSDGPRHLEAIAIDHEAGVLARFLIMLELFLEAQVGR